jgi:F0F1-type ATP synthase epsilon subunit
MTDSSVTPPANFQQIAQQTAAPLGPNSLFLTIRTRQDILYQSAVKAVSSLNDTGPFDILAQHANFISVIQKVLTIHELNGTQRQLEIGTGILQAEPPRVNVYLDK